MDEDRNNLSKESLDLLLESAKKVLDDFGSSLLFQTALDTAKSSKYRPSTLALPSCLY